jgi:hypothetical protein
MTQGMSRVGTNHRRGVLQLAAESLENLGRGVAPALFAQGVNRVKTNRLVCGTKLRQEFRYAFIVGLCRGRASRPDYNCNGKQQSSHDPLPLHDWKSR